MDKGGEKPPINTTSCRRWSAECRWQSVGGGRWSVGGVSAECRRSVGGVSVVAGGVSVVAGGVSAECRRSVGGGRRSVGGGWRSVGGGRRSVGGVSAECR